MNFKKLYAALTSDACRTEESVKAFFIKYAGFPAYIRDKVDLYVGSTLFEFKYNIKDLETNWPPILAQAVMYLRKIMKGEINLAEPAHIVLIDKNEGMIFQVTPEIKAVAENDNLKWDRPASQPDRGLIKVLRELSPEKVYFSLNSETGIKEFIENIHRLNAEFPPAKRTVSEQNFEEVFEHWCEHFGEHFPDDSSTGLLFIADLLEETVFRSERGILFFPTVSNASYHVPAQKYIDFWNSFSRPPASDVQGYIIERAHLFMPVRTRRFEGAFFTPVPVARKVYEYLYAALPENWEDEYYVWDPACGTGNLQVPHRRTDRLFMSTLNIEEVLMLKSGNYFPDAEIFQFDFLNDDFDKLPDTLKRVIVEEPEKLIIVMNPPYSEARNHAGSRISKTGVSKTKVGEEMMVAGYGKATNELFIQFLYRCIVQFPLSRLVFFSKLKLYSGRNSENILSLLMKNHLIDRGFIIPGNVFPGVSGNFPISIAFVKPNLGRDSADSVTLDVFKTMEENKIGEKQLLLSPKLYIREWFTRPETTEPATPVKGIALATDVKIYSDKWAKNSFGYSVLMPDMQNSGVSFIVSSVHYNGHGSCITPELFEKVMLSIAVRHIPKHTWTNDRDQFEIPFCDRETSPSNETNLPEEFINNCIVWLLFHGQNRSAAFSDTYEGNTVVIKNEFFPFLKNNVKNWVPTDLAMRRSIDRHPGETFVCNWLTERADQFSEEAQAILDAGYLMYKRFYQEYPNLNATKWKLGFWNPGWYQIRMSLKEHLGNSFPELDALTEASRTMRAKLRPLIYEYGFLAPEMLYEETEEDDDDEEN